MNNFDKANLTNFRDFESSATAQLRGWNFQLPGWISSLYHFFVTAGLDASKVGGNKQIVEMRGELINVIKKRKRLLDAVRNAC